MQVKKRNGEIEEFDKEKFLSSLHKAGFEDSQISEAMAHVSQLGDLVTTDEIYHKAIEILKNNKQVEPVIKYSLKKAVQELGPSGFPFEKLIARIFEEKGYTTHTGITIQGKCIDHEIDVVAYNDSEVLLMEAKFHNEQGMKSDTKVALYVKARFDDLSDATFEIDGKKLKMTRGILITNTNFTNHAKKYVSCVGSFDMISWSYPKGNGLLRMIEDLHIHPITSIPQLSESAKNELIANGIIYCKDLLADPSALDNADVKSSKHEEILNTARLICNS